MTNINYLRTFLEIVKRGSFTEATKVLRVTHPAVSLQIQRLEVELATTLVLAKLIADECHYDLL